MKNIKRTYLLLVIVIGLVFLATYSTYALFTSSLEIGDITLDTELKYTFKINSNQEFTIGANSKLRFNAIVENDMEGTISYGVYYKMISPTEINDSIIIAEVSDTTTLTTSGPIEAGAENNITVPLVIINNTSDEIKVQIGVRTGYYTESMTPEDIIYESGEVLITDIIDSETAGSYQCEGVVGENCTEECYTIKENGYLNEYCGTLCSELVSSTKLVNLDESGANKPELTDNLVPVMHNGTTWVVADSENSDETYQWYDYDAKKWANAVLLTTAKRNSLTKDSEGNYTPGQEIGDTENGGVLAFYVWIPRYKYKVWNINKVINIDSYGAETQGIDIQFIGKDEEGTITCEYSFKTPSSNKGEANEVCSDAQVGTGYYTHPAFKVGNTNLTGIWVGKFELSSETPLADYGGGETATSPRILPNVISWVRNPVTNFWKAIDNMQASNNTYGLTTDHTKVDSHMLTNMEWGAVAYLTHSKYGRCNGSSCTEVGLNSYYSDAKTGCGPQSSGSTNYGTTCNVYTSTLGKTASTTGNTYGVYDMSGGAEEYVMGNMSSTVGSYTYYASYGGSNYTYSGNEKYITTYAYGTNYYEQIAYNRGRLGDATSEVRKSSGNWYNDQNGFPYSDSPWFIRGSFSTYGASTGVFAFYYNDGRGWYGMGIELGSRASLVVYP